MPPKGGNLEASDADVKAAVDYMLASVKAAAAPAKPAAAAAAAPVAAAPAAAPAAPATAAAVAATNPSANTSGVSAADINSFNRLLKPIGKRNPPPAEDGIHDPANDGTLALMAPLAAYGPLPKSLAGNRINWVKAIEENKINPRWDRNDPAATPVVIDLNIVREVKGSMPDVVYPHKQHTEWLDCSNCHPAIFNPQKGSNAISMAAILLGEKCGVCHGKVAFPVSECRLCHSKKKEARPAQAAAATAK
jgi:c(7)-type cytochrome triheme protein